MSATKPDLLAMNRLLRCHLWCDAGEWAQAIHALADLSDAQIELLAAADRPRDRADTAPPVESVARSSR